MTGVGRPLKCRVCETEGDIVNTISSIDGLCLMCFREARAWLSANREPQSPTYITIISPVEMDDWLTNGRET